MVLHLWGGFNSDSHIEYNIEKLEELNEVASEYGVKVLVENIPSRIYDPRRNWQKLLPSMDNAGFVFDTRFGMLHRQIEGIILDSALMEKVEHVHISDFAGTYRQFRALRPILHPGEGSVDFKKTASLLRDAGYDAQVAKNVDRDMFRVIASTFDDKLSAVNSRDQLRTQFPDAWLLYNVQ
jgi:sugar phosphate isomerase/epimerase